jgi:tetratricopeptide (TPR) repeat protein
MMAGCSLISKALGKDNAALADILGSIIFMMQMQVQIEPARPLIHRLVTIWEKERISCFHISKRLSDSGERKASLFVNGLITLNNLAVTYIKKRDYLDAEQLLDEAIRLDPRYALAFGNRSIVKRALGDTKGANEDAKQEVNWELKRR